MQAQGGRALFIPLDLSRVSTASQFSSDLRRAGIERVSLLVNCAGAMGGARSDTMSVNLLSPTALSLGLMPLLKASTRPRIVNVGSSSHLRATSVEPELLHDVRRDRSLRAYGQSKLGLMQVSRVLCASEPSVSVHDVHPGIVWTPMLQQQLGVLGPLLYRSGLVRLLFKTPECGAEMVLAAALSPSERPEEGKPSYWVGGTPAPQLASPESCDEAAAQQMWVRIIAPELEAAGIPSLVGKSRS
ncbi:MAG: hypothetical protein SGPRY_007291 [Prymnesium sp.]